MSIYPFSKSFVFSTLLLISLALSACGGKKQDVVTTPAPQPTSGVNCELWKKNRTFMSASYGLAQSKGDKIFINKLSIQQLMGSLDLSSDAEMDKVRGELIDMLSHAPLNPDPLYTIEFTQPAITLRDHLALGIQAYIEKCPE
jgi:hypothetical protein